MSEQDIEKQIHAAFKQAVAFHQMGQLEQAASIYRQLLRINPNQAEILHLLGLVSYQMGVYGEAVALLGRAVEIQPNIAKFHNHLGSALFALGKKEAAIAQFRRAVECPEPSADAYHNLGVALYDDGRWNESIAVYEAGIKRHPGDGLLLNEVLKNMAEACRWGGVFDSYAAQLFEKTRKHLAEGKVAPLTPYHSLCLSDDPKMQHSLAQLHAKRIDNAVKAAKQQMNFVFEKGHKPSGHHHALRVGYVCADFRDHPTAHLIGNMLELHDKDKVEVFAYALGEGDDSPYRERIKNASKRFTEVQNMPFHQLAQQVYQDKIDVLIDLMGYISGAQPEIFALRPAPINVSFLAYPGTLGAGFMDYLVTDHVALADARHISEVPFYMPNSYFVSDASLDVPLAKDRISYGLPEKGLVLGCFNKPSKITPEMFLLWCDLLKTLPDSVLWLYAPNDDTQSNLRAEAQRKGVSPERLVFARKVDKKEHLARYAHMDIFLDCSPVTAHTTAIDALLMGVPIVTIKGNTIISRASASILTAAGFPELVCDNMDAYKAKILELTSDDAALASLKAKVRESAVNSPLFDTKTYVKHFESGLHQAFQTWLEGEKPSVIEA